MTFTDEQLEAYLDGELESPLRERVTDQLREDPALRERLRIATHTDNLIASALTSSCASTHAAAHPWRRVGLYSPAAAAVIILALAPRLLLPTAPVASPILPAPSVVAEAVRSSPIRVIVSIPIRHSDTRAAPLITPADPAPPVAVAPVGPALHAALLRGDADDAAALLTNADESERAKAIAVVGELLRSADTARRVLDSLPQERQLQACAQWALDPRLRPIAFERLQQLKSVPALADQLALATDQLGRHRELRAWLVSYELAPSRGG